MGIQKQKWTQQEEDALLKGIAKHGAGKWKNIVKDPEFASILTLRSNIDLKDKWRNLCVNSSDKIRAKAKVFTSPLPSNNNDKIICNVQQNAAPVVAVDKPVMDDVVNNVTDGKVAPRYDGMIFEALSTLNDANGCDISAIVNCIEQRHEVPPNLRKVVGPRLRRLAAQGKVEKLQNGYRINKGGPLEMKAPIPLPKDERPRKLQNSRSNSGGTMEEAAISAACKIAEAENRSSSAAEAVREAEKVSKLAEETDAILQIVKDFHEQCSQGEVILLA